MLQPNCRRQISFVIALASLTLSATGAVAGVSDAKEAEAAAFASIQERHYCDAARLFVEANAHAPNIDLLFNAAIAASKATDNLLAARLMGKVNIATGNSQQEILDELATLEAKAAGHPGVHCPAAVDLDDKAALIGVIRDLEVRIAALERAKTKSRDAKQAQAYNVEVLNSAWMGADHGDIDVVVYTDYQCPFCARVHPMLESLTTDQRTKDRVRVVYKHFPLSFHKKAMPAAIAALAAREQGMDAFWKFTAEIFKVQRDLTPEKFSSVAEKVGLNVRAFENDLRNNAAAYGKEIERDMTTGKSEHSIRGTPTILVNGWMLKNRTLEGVLELGNAHSKFGTAPKEIWRRVRTKASRR